MALDLTGEIVGEYEIIKRIGTGTMSIVFLGRHTETGADAAVKVLERMLDSDARRQAFFEQSVGAAAALDHPHILKIYDFGTLNGYPYIITPFMSHRALADHIVRSGNQLPLDETVSLVNDIADALHYAHEHGVIHQDLKPSNILMDAGDHPMLAAVGTFRVLGLSVAEINWAPFYTAPELVADREHPTRAVDIYALGVTVYEMLTGDVPFMRPSAAQTMQAHLSDPVPDVRERRPDLPEGVTAVIQRAMAKDPADRFPTALDLASHLALTAEGSLDMLDVPVGPKPAESRGGLLGRLFGRRKSRQ